MAMQGDAPREPTVRIAAVAGAGVEAAAETLTALAQAGKLAGAVREMVRGLARAREGESPDRRRIALALLADLHNARQKGWRLLLGPSADVAEHAWLENDRVALDGSATDTEGNAVLMVIERRAYRKASGAAPSRAFSPADVLSGRYRRETGDTTGEASGPA